MKKVNKKRNSVLTTVLAVVVILLVGYFNLDVVQEEEGIDNVQEESSVNGLIPVEFVKTIDGDTIRVMYEGEERKLRYLLIDTPELNHSQTGRQPFAEEATKRNDELLNSGKLEIEFDIGEHVDKYGRLLAYVYIDGESVQEKLVEEGLARVGYVYPPNTRHLDLLEEAQRGAKKAGIGIWSLENYVTERGFDSKNYKE